VTPAARLDLLDDDNKIQDEQVVFFAVPDEEWQREGPESGAALGPNRRHVHAVPLEPPSVIDTTSPKACESLAEMTLGAALSSPPQLASQEVVGIRGGLPGWKSL